MSIFHTRPTNPTRPPDWRWLRAVHAVQTTPDRRLFCDGTVLTGYRLKRAIDNCRSDYDLEDLCAAFPVEGEMWVLYSGGSNTSARATRYDLEARLMANERHADIARKLAVTPAHVKFYHDLFFDVHDRLAAPDALMPALFPQHMTKGLESLPLEDLWKLVGYWGGPNVLDNFVQVISGDASAGEANIFYDERFRVVLARRAFVTAIQMRVGWEQQTEILNLHLRVKELEKTEDKGQMGERAIVNNINTFFSQMPWQKAHAYQTAGSDMARLEDRSTSFRDDELAHIAATGEVPQELAAIMASAEDVDFGVGATNEKNG